MMRFIQYTRNHAVGFTISVISIVVLTIFAYFTFDALVYGGKVRVKFEVVPQDALLTINGEKMGSGTIALKPGQYRIIASKVGYTQYERTLFVHQGSQEVLVPVSLRGETAEAKQEEGENRIAYLKNEGLGSRQAQNDGRLFRERNPIVSKLPFKNYIYSIGYRADKSDPSGMSIIIEINASEGNRANAVSQIERWGYDPTKLKIQFRDYRNPFNEV